MHVNFFQYQENLKLKPHFRFRAMRNLPLTRPLKVDSIQTETTKASSSASNSHHDVRDHTDLTEKPMLSKK